MRVGVTGATGFVGRAVVAELVRRGDAVTALTRDPESASMPSGVAIARFDVNEPKPDPSALEGMDAIVHLAGESVDGRWTEKKKKAIYESRVTGTRNLVAAMTAATQKPGTLISASAVGFFGDRGDELLDEESAPGGDFLASVCVGWEREAKRAVTLGMRVANVRVSMVLGRGGALGKLQPIFRLGLGGPIGNGRQWMPWIHRDDLARLFCFALDREDVRGPMCGVSPEPATNAQVMRAFGHALHRPAVLPVPAFALRMVVGEFAETLLGGQRINPKKATDAGFSWKHPELGAALRELFG